MRRLSSFALLACLIASPAMSKEHVSQRFLTTALLCETLLENPSAVMAALKKDGWADTTPAMMGQMTGSYTFRKKSDEAIVGLPNSIAEPSCQFDFAKVSERAAENVIAELTTLIGSEPTTSGGITEWNTANGTVSLLSRSENSLTIMWLPKSEKAE